MTTLIKSIYDVCDGLYAAQIRNILTVRLQYPLPISTISIKLIELEELGLILINKKTGPNKNCKTAHKIRKYVCDNLCVSKV